ncbi:phosphatase PAP2 family protein [Geobacter argillaceus]|nr:phosphatase PAP2 family protein [Geobacter argillaceus]
MEQIEMLNRALFLKINALPDTAPWAIGVAKVVADDLIYIIPALLIIYWLWGSEAKRSLALKACLVAMLGVGINQLIGLAWQHPRPFMIGLGHTWVPHVADSSFPSDHMTVFVGIGISLLFGGEVLAGILTLVTGMAVAWSRVFLGVHFPLDMMGSIGMASLSYTLISPVWRRVGNTVTTLIEMLYRSIMARPIERGLMRR